MVILNPSCHGSVHGISCRGDCYSFGDDGDRCSSGNVDHGYHGDDVADVSSGGNVDDGYHGDDGDDVCSGGNVDDGYHGDDGDDVAHVPLSKDGTGQL